MKAIVLTDYGDVDKLELRDVPEPKPAPGEIKVRVAGASINVIDVKMSRLRAKLVNSGVRILTVRGAGFRLEEA